MKVSWTARRSNQSILKEINPEYSLEGLIEAPILWLPVAKSRLTGKGPDAGKIEGRRGQQRRDVWMASLTQWTCV